MSKKNNIYIIEGFDGVGKDFYIKQNLADMKSYRPCYDVFDRFFGRQDSWVIGFSIFDFLSRITSTKTGVVINRCIASSLVYSELYNGRLHLHKDLDKLIEFYKSNKHFQEANHIHIKHKDANSAKKIYSLMNQRPDNEGFDDFDGFYDYWKNYSLAELLFSKYYRMLGIKPTYVENEYEESQESDICCPRYEITKASAVDLSLCSVCDQRSECNR